jgi:hypothetical protein
VDSLQSAGCFEYLFPYEHAATGRCRGFPARIIHPPEGKELGEEVNERRDEQAFPETLNVKKHHQRNEISIVGQNLVHQISERFRWM